MHPYLDDSFYLQFFLAHGRMPTIEEELTYTLDEIGIKPDTDGFYHRSQIEAVLERAGLSVAHFEAMYTGYRPLRAGSLKRARKAQSRCRHGAPNANSACSTTRSTPAVRILSAVTPIATPI
jgi:hypothetical protein